MRSSSGDRPTLILGIGNVLMGDEGVGVEAVRRVAEAGVPDGVECLDGGTGGFALLEPMLRAGRIVLIDAALDGAPPGTVRRLTPRFSSDYPPSLTAHDIGLKDVIDAFHMMGGSASVVLLTVSVDAPREPRLGLTPAAEAAIAEVVRMAIEEAGVEGHRRAPAGA